MTTLGDRIASAREAKGLLQSDLAKQVGVKSSAVISNWETNKHKPNAEQLVNLCSALDVTLSYLLDYYGKEGFTITPEERIIIEKLRSISPRTKETIIRLIDLEIQENQDN